jgi:hypothetical protein
MAVFSVNQATQFYVGTPTPKTNGTDTYFLIDGVATDRIKADHILSYRVNQVDDLNVKAPVPTITVGTPVKGAEYLVRLTITTDAGPQYAYIKSVGVVAADTNATNVAKQIADALTKAAKRDVAGEYYTAASSGAKVTITPNVDHQVGKRFVVPVIEVSVSVITDHDASAEGWVVAPKEVVATTIADTGLMKLKDLEYFCAGEKGDVYRGAMWPNEIPFESKLAGVDGTYNIHTIHYYEDLSNEAVQKSEKTMIIVTSGATDDIFTSAEVDPEYSDPAEE